MNINALITDTQQQQHNITTTIPLHYGLTIKSVMNIGTKNKSDKNIVKKYMNLRMTEHKLSTFCDETFAQVTG